MSRPSGWDEGAMDLRFPVRQRYLYLNSGNWDLAKLLENRGEIEDRLTVPFPVTFDYLVDHPRHFVFWFTDMLAQEWAVEHASSITHQRQLLFCADMEFAPSDSWEFGYGIRAVEVDAERWAALKDLGWEPVFLER